MYILTERRRASLLRSVLRKKDDRCRYYSTNNSPHKIHSSQVANATGAHNHLSFQIHPRSLSPIAIFRDQQREGEKLYCIYRDGIRSNNSHSSERRPETKRAFKRRKRSFHRVLIPSSPPSRTGFQRSRTERRRCNGSSRLETVLYSWPGFAWLSRMLMRACVTTVLCP